jgi:hypothetical protein
LTLAYLKTSELILENQMDSAKGFKLAESDEDARNALHWEKK